MAPFADVHNRFAEVWGVPDQLVGFLRAREFGIVHSPVKAVQHGVVLRGQLAADMLHVDAKENIHPVPHTFDHRLTSDAVC